MSTHITPKLPSGWLVSRNGEQMILFIKDPMSGKSLPKFYVDKWFAIDGIRSKFKNRRIVSQDEALLMWNNLINDGWGKVQTLLNSVA